MDLKDKVAIVTGASGGIGLATARILAKEGAKVALAARSGGKLREISKSLPGSLPVRADLTKPDDIENLVRAVMDRYGRIDILVNNAGRGYDAPIETTDLSRLRAVIDLDLIGPILAMKLVIPIMRKQGGGAILNVSSGTALMHLPDMGGYSAVKGALASVSLTAREELKKDHIAVGVVYPYMTLTDFEENTIRDVPEDEEEEHGGYTPPPPDTAEFIAEKIVDGIRTGAAEVFAHDWMKKPR